MDTNSKQFSTPKKLHIIKKKAADILSHTKTGKELVIPVRTVTNKILGKYDTDKNVLWLSLLRLQKFNIRMY